MSQTSIGTRRVLLFGVDFMSLLHIDVTQVLEILPQVKSGPTYST